MMIPDVVNGLFEFGGGVFILNHCRTLLKDKRVAGVSILSTVFFAMWGGWNIFYYRHLEQFASFSAGLLVLFANSLWIALMCYYKKHPGGKLALLKE
jgi:uncharacterized membrane protein YfcA